MPLNKPLLEQRLKQIMDDLSNDSNVNPQTARNQMASRMANAIEEYVKSGTVISTGAGYQGTPVQSTGTIS